MKSSRRDLLNDTAEHRSTLKNSQNRYTRFIYAPKTGKNFLKPVSRFYCDRRSQTPVEKKMCMLCAMWEK